MTRSPEAGPIRILFVCMGNICRSPLAESIFRHRARDRGVLDRFVIDSAGTGDWHAGERPDGRMRGVARQRGVVVDGQARQVVPHDFERFDYLICMDDSNRRQLERFGAPKAKLRLLLDADPSAPVREVPDPYYGGRRGFESVYNLVDRACSALLDELLAAPR
jgi:protein-tyrosine phosphatase